MSQDQNSHAVTLQGELEEIPVRITVINDFTKEKVSYSTSVNKDGLMFGALNNLQDTNKDFKFTYTIHKIFGLYLESVNGVVESKKDKTYWHLSSEINGIITSLQVGMGRYQPQKNENLILTFKSWA